LSFFAAAQFRCDFVGLGEGVQCQVFQSAETFVIIGGGIGRAAKGFLGMLDPPALRTDYHCYQMDYHTLVDGLEAPKKLSVSVSFIDGG